MIQEHFAMLQGMVDRGIAHQVEIHYNTNGTHYPDSAAEIWRHFKTVEIAFSIDDVDQRFEYQRTNAVWTDVLKNLVRFRQLRSEMPNIQLQCCTTVNVFNVQYLKHVASWIEHQGFDYVYWNIMHDAWYFSIATLPDTAKLAVTAYLDNCKPPEQFRQDFANIRDFMNRGASNDGFMLRMKIADLDRKRDQDFAQVCPEMAEIIDYVKT
jgi:MoaA/NifB/PqqE/SkfB family radical SAM enzyme